MKQADLRKQSDEFQLGYDCGVNGANERNCSFKIFSTPEKTKEWERGKAAGDKVKIKTPQQ